MHDDMHAKAVEKITGRQAAAEARLNLGEAACLAPVTAGLLRIMEDMGQERIARIEVIAMLREAQTLDTILALKN